MSELQRANWPSLIHKPLAAFFASCVIASLLSMILVRSAKLKGERFGEFGRYRIGDDRVVARIVDSEALILVLRIGHRREIYR